jgi:hypothetical protein
MKTMIDTARAIEGTQEMQSIEPLDELELEIVAGGGGEATFG